MTFSRPLCAALLAAVAVLAFTQSTPAQSEGGGPARVVLSGEQLDESGFQLRAFVGNRQPESELPGDDE